MLQVRNLSTGYEKKQVLFGISFDVNAGEVVLLIGSNGSGKSTLLKAIYGLLPPFLGGTGELIFNGEHITYCPPSQLIRKGLVYVPQKNNCFDNLSVRENLEVSTLSLPNNLERKRALARSLEKLPMLQTSLKKYPHQLSGGEKQLLALAIGMTHSPKMMLLDEPFAGLTEQHIALVKSQILQLNRKGVTILMVEHRIKQSISLTNRVVGFKLGRIALNCSTNGDLDPEILKEIMV